MRVWMATVWVACVVGCLAVNSSWAQDETEVAAQPVVVEDESFAGVLPDSAESAALAWEESLRATPRLVSLKDAEETTDLRQALQDRIKRLGEKTFSNREWKGYWQRQKDTATALAEALAAGNAASARVQTMKDWASLAGSKVENQERFFEAIQSERDALEDRLEAAMEASGADEESEEKEAEEYVEKPNPYERRTLHLADLQRRIDQQKTRRRAEESQIAFIARQLESEKILSGALEKDLELAQNEHQIAMSQREGPANGWSVLWGEVADAASGKVEKISADAEYAEARQRSRQVEEELAKSQLDFRSRRIDALQADYDHDSGVASWLVATKDTLLNWLKQSAWKILIGLVLIYLGVRVALRVLKRAVVLILERTDDDPDVDDDSDQRRQTLADVFSGVARIAIYILAALMALEQVGINTGPILGSVAILGLAISFGSQNLVRDVVNGFFILLENQFAVGDVVSINGKTGGVERITIRSTWVREYTGNLHVIPNGSINLVSNLTRGWSRAVCDIGVGYGSDLEQVERVVNEVGAALYADEAWHDQMDEAPEWVGVTELGDSAVTIRVHVKVDAGSQWGVLRELYQRMKVAFDKEGIDIPYPQQVVHHINAPE